MPNRTLLSLPLLALTIAAGTGFPQTQEASITPEQPKFYKLEFVVKEVEAAKTLNARSYTMTVSTANNDNFIRTGSKVPVVTGGLGNSTSFQYIDVGVNIDCGNFKEVAHNLSLSVSADISSIPQAEAGATTESRPMIRQNRWRSAVIVPMKKPTVIFSSDDLTSKRQMQLELTATPIQ